MVLACSLHLIFVAWISFAAAQVDLPISHRPSALRTLAKRDGTASATWAHEAGLQLAGKYGFVTAASASSVKRQAAVKLTDSFTDASYSATLAIGTPPQQFEMILDTGSADLWITSAECSEAAGCPRSVSPFVTAASTSLGSSDTNFSVTYGSGSASGFLSTDSVSLGGFTVTGTTFAVCSKVKGILKSGAADISGLMGMGWQSLSTSGAMPVWQSLVQRSAWKSPEFAFALRRWINVAGAENIEDGGYLTLGGVNRSLFVGEMNYIPLATTPSYWEIPLQALTVDDTLINIGKPNVAIDTGTSLVGAPSAVLQNLFSQIAGSFEVRAGEFAGYWVIPCEVNTTISLQFGGKVYPMNEADFNLGRLPDAGGGCVTSFFSVDISPAGGKNIPDWIIGAAFMKNVYVSFRAEPPSIGLAQLAASFNEVSTARVQLATPPDETPSSSPSPFPSSSPSPSPSPSSSPSPSPSRSPSPFRFPSASTSPAATPTSKNNTTNPAEETSGAFSTLLEKGASSRLVVVFMTFMSVLLLQ